MKDRPDLVNRVFWLKLKNLINDIEKGKIFGEVISLLWVVEFQKLGKPHAHLLVTLGRNSKLKTGADIDECVSAERPHNNPELLALVDHFMIHSNNSNYDKAIEIKELNHVHFEIESFFLSCDLCFRFK